MPCRWRWPLARTRAPCRAPRRVPARPPAWCTAPCAPAPCRPAGPAQRAALGQQHPDALLFCFPKHGHALERDFKWLGSHRYGIVHLGGRDREQLRERAEQASALLGWPAPYLDRPRPQEATFTRPGMPMPTRLDISHDTPGASR